MSTIAVTGHLVLGNFVFILDSGTLLERLIIPAIFPSRSCVVFMGPVLLSLDVTCCPYCLSLNVTFRCPTLWLRDWGNPGPSFGLASSSKVSRILRGREEKHYSFFCFLPNFLNKLTKIDSVY